MIDLVKKDLEKSLKGAQIIVEDPRGDGYHLALTVISDNFKGKSKLERHRMIYAILGSKVGNEIHALTMSLLTKEEASV